MRRLISLIATVAIATTLAIGVVAVNPPAADATCTQARITLYTGQNGSGGSRQFCYPTDVSNLSNVSAPNFICGVFNGSWNDCARSFRYQEPGVNTAVCLWEHSNYGGNGLIVLSDVGTYNLPSWLDQKASSIEWGNNCQTD